MRLCLTATCSFAAVEIHHLLLLAIMQKFTAIAFGTLVVGLSATTATPATAALLQFSFTTQSGGAGSFVLDTNTVAETEVPRFFAIREGNRAYLNAVSSFSFTSPERSFSNLAGDFGVFPVVEFGAFLGAPEQPGAYTAVYAPAGCLFDPRNFCPTEFPIAYIGDRAALPVLSSNPADYAGGFDIARIDPVTGALSSDPLTSFSVEAVPEPATVVGTIVAAIGGSVWSRKRKQR
jgi:hypothetical protein